MKYEMVSESKNENIENRLEPLNDSEITLSENVLKPQYRFGYGAHCKESIEVCYISDIHLRAHMVNDGINIADEKEIIKYIDATVKRIAHPRCFNNDCAYRFHDEQDGNKKPRLDKCVVFLGDISSDQILVELFFKRLLLRLRFFEYKKWKKNNGYIHQEYKAEPKEYIEELYNQKHETLVKNVEKYLNRIKVIEERLGKKIYDYYSNKYDYERLIKQRKDIPDYAAYLIRNANRAQSRLNRFEDEKEEFFRDYSTEYVESFLDVQIETCPIFYIIGNHELVNFDTVDEAVNHYKRVLEKYHVTVLQNTVIDYSNCIMLGGCGFAKYNQQYNCETLIGARKMAGNREYEIEESERFAKMYFDALKKAKRQNKPLIVFSHYPVTDWLDEKPDSQCYYFYGHNHINSYSKCEDYCIIADNQIGYKNNDIDLKYKLLGTAYNPFIDYEDGVYEIKVEQYLAFYEYSGERVGAGLVERQLNNNAHFYMIKKEGFYGFFLVNNKGTKICAGGKIKAISSIKDINYFDRMFLKMVNTYIEALLPFRKIQERIAEEVKSLGINSFESGRIHGTIVDVDYYHHIMLNPFDGTITYYYSERFGQIVRFPTFENLLQSVEKNNRNIGKDKNDNVIKKLSANKDIIVLKQFNSLEKICGGVEVIDVKNSLYTYSAKFNQIQRLFTANILRDWNDELVGGGAAELVLNQQLSDQKKLSSYQLVQKHWRNLLDIDSELINIKLVDCALNPRRKCPFPYLKFTPHVYREWVRMSDEDIIAYIQHIPDNILRESFPKFEYSLGRRIIYLYPMRLIDDTYIDKFFDDKYYNNKEIIEMVSKIPITEMTEHFKKRFANRITHKNKQAYCSKELWDLILKYRD